MSRLRIRRRVVDLVEGVGALDAYFSARRRMRRWRSALGAEVGRRRFVELVGPLPDGYTVAHTGRRWHVAATERSVRLHDLRQDNFETLTAALVAGGIEYFVVATGSHERTAVGVPASRRAETLRALRAAETAPNWCVTTSRDGSIVPVALVDDARWSADVADAAVLDTYHVVTDAGAVRVVGRALRCELQFWTSTEEEEEGGGPSRLPGPFLRPPTGNPFVEEIPASRIRQDSITVAGRDHPIAPEFRWYLDGAECPFPIDVVYTWVDGDDPAWRERRDEAASVSSRVTVDGGADERFRTFDELRYSLRSVWQYVPHVRHVYVVTDRQRPSWLDGDHPMLSIVDHRDVFDDPSVLPTFNSHAIETQLHHVEGLCEHYLYLNDDVFFGRLSDWSTYFDRSGRSRFFPSRARFRFGDPGTDDPSVDNAGKNLQRELVRETGWAPWRKIKHTPHPQQRSLMYEIEGRFPDAYRTTRGARFRSTTDVSLAVALHHRYGEAVGRTSVGTIAYQYLNLADHNLPDRLDRLLVSDDDTFCLNDGAMTGDHEAIRREVLAFLDARFPFVAPWETDR